MVKSKTYKHIKEIHTYVQKLKIKKKKREKQCWDAKMKNKSCFSGSEILEWNWNNHDKQLSDIMKIR